MENIKVTVTKYKVFLNHHQDGSAEETLQQRVASYEDSSLQPDNSPESKQKAITEIASKLVGMNEYELGAAKDQKKSHYFKLILSSL